MPKKTKKEKIIAEYRRKLQRSIGASAPKNTDVSQNQSEPISQLSSEPIYKIGNVIAKKQDVQRPASVLTDFNAIRMDLVKTITLAAAAIVTELILYWKFGR